MFTSCQWYMVPVREAEDGCAADIACVDVCKMNCIASVHIQRVNGDALSFNLHTHLLEYSASFAEFLNTRQASI